MSKHTRTQKRRATKHSKRVVRKNSKTQKRRTSKHSKKGGMVEGVLGAAKTALLPYLMYKAQKRVQNKSSKKTSKK